MKKDEPRRHAFDQIEIDQTKEEFDHVAKQFEEGDLVLLWDKEK
jgi:hypothetical protein